MYFKMHCEHFVNYGQTENSTRKFSYNMLSTVVLLFHDQFNIFDLLLMNILRHIFIYN